MRINKSTAISSLPTSSFSFHQSRPFGLDAFCHLDELLSQRLVQVESFPGVWRTTKTGGAVLEGTSQELMENPDVKSAHFGL